MTEYQQAENARFLEVFRGGQSGRLPDFNFSFFYKNEKAMELFNTIFENSSPKGSFRLNKIKFEILVLSPDSSYLWSAVLKSL